MVGYSGWNAATYVAEELRLPEADAAGGAGRRYRAGGRALHGLNMVFIYATPLET